MKKIILLSISFAFMSLAGIAQDNVFPLPNGNVGIGTTNPLSKLHIKDPAGGAALRVERGGKSWNFSIQNTGNSLFLNNSDNTNTFFTFNKEGKFGIGTTSPFSPLQVNSALDGVLTLQTTDNTWLYTNYLDNTGTRKTWMGLDANLSSFNINVENGTDKILFNGGNVGIGTTNPKAKLQVIGNINASDHINANQYISVSKGGSHRVAMNGQGDGYISGRNDQVQGKFLIHSNGNSFLNGGNVGIGTSAPNSKLHVAGNGAVIKLQNTSYEDTDNAFYGWLGGYDKSGDEIWWLGEGSGSSKTLGFYINRDGYDLNLAVKGKGIIIKNGGNVGIGTTTPDSKLAVNGKIHAKEVKVDLSGWPDYVFEDEYKLPTLKEIENHIEEKGHLPNIPSAKVVEKEGIQLGEMNSKLLQKIEELTLYMIEQNKKTEQLQKEVMLLKQKMKH